jgi:thiosulfate/3-mercaptopyruvate sulfurtransferase
MASEEAGENMIVDARWLGAHRGDDRVVLVDTRPAEEFSAGHLEGARHFDPFPFHHSDTSESGMRQFRGQLEWIFSALGISGEQTVVFYENNSGMRAARGAWALEYMGHPAVRILDGGIRIAAGEKIVAEVKPLIPSFFRGRPREELAATHEYIAQRLGSPAVQIFDVRSDEEYYGERVRARRGGAIPGAIHREWTANIGADGAFKPAAQLRAEFQKMGLDPDAEIIPYCQGGYRSASAYVALRIAGFRHVRNYLGSWGEWGNRDDLPIGHPRRPG